MKWLLVCGVVLFALPSWSQQTLDPNAEAILQAVIGSETAVLRLDRLRLAELMGIQTAEQITAERAAVRDMLQYWSDFLSGLQPTPPVQQPRRDSSPMPMQVQ